MPFDAWSGKISWRRKWQPTSVFLPGKSHGQRSLWLHWMIKWQASFRHSYEAKSQTTRIKFGEALRSHSCQTPHIIDGKLKPREVNLFGRSFCLLIAKKGQEPRTAARYSGKNTGLWPSRSATHWLAVWSQLSLLASLSFSFLTYKNVRRDVILICLLSEGCQSKWVWRCFTKCSTKMIMCVCLYWNVAYKVSWEDLGRRVHIG